MSGDLIAAQPSSIRSLAPVDREVGVTLYLADARDRLALALAESGPEQVASLRAEMATVQEMTKQLGLSKEIQDDAAEMVRRCEYGLGKAIRAGQAAGVVARTGSVRGVPEPGVRGSMPSSTERIDLPASPTTFLGPSGQGGSEIYALAEATEAEFEDALGRAREEKNVSRANVVRKVREVTGGENTPAEKWERVAEMADRGYTSAQIAREVGMSEPGLKRGAQREGIDIRADRVMGKVRRLDVRRVIEQTVADLESVVNATESLLTLDGVAAAEIAEEEALEWVDSLHRSAAAIRKAANLIAKATAPDRSKESA